MPESKANFYNSILQVFPIMERPEPCISYAGIGMTWWVVWISPRACFAAGFDVGQFSILNVASMSSVRNRKFVC